MSIMWLSFFAACNANGFGYKVSFLANPSFSVISAPCVVKSFFCRLAGTAIPLVGLIDALYMQF